MKTVLASNRVGIVISYSVQQADSVGVMSLYRVQREVITCTAGDI